MFLGTVAQAQPRFDLPAQPLADSLRAVGSQTDTNVLFDPPLVADRTAPPLKGELSSGQALAQLLIGTGIKYEFLNDRTIVLGSATPSIASVSGVGQGAAPIVLTARNDGAGPQSKTFWDRFRVAEVDQGSSAVESSSSSSSNSSSSNSDEKTKNQPKLEEVIVTAQRRTEDPQKVPESMQVVSGLALEEQNQDALIDLTRTMPAVHIDTGVKSNDLSIRGIGAGGSNPGFDQAVAIFADDIYRGRSNMIGAAFLDLDRIEVLKGPQSTFFGNNAIAGALNIISEKPGDTFGGYIRALGGMFEQYALEGAAGGPITDTLKARLAVTANGNERGWLTDINSGEHIPRIHNLAGRLTLVYQPTEALDATLKLEGSHHKTEGAFIDEPIQFGACTRPPLSPGFGSALSCPMLEASGIPHGYDTNQVSQLGGLQNRLSNVEGVLTLNYRRWNHTFTSVTGNSYYDFLQDVGGTPPPSIEVEWVEHYHQFSQELRVASPTGQAIEYLAGVYFHSNRLAYDQIDTFPFFSPFLQGTPVASHLPLAYRDGILQGEHAYSAFGALTWNVTNRLKLSTGLRGSQVDKDYNAHVIWGTGTKLYGGLVEDPFSVQQFVSNLFSESLGTSPRLSRSSHALMPSARVQYQFNPDVMGYFRYDRGFLSGGFNGSDVFNFGHITQFGPEYVNAYEVGLKGKWLNDTVLLNLDLFLADYTDLQVSTNILRCFPGAGCGYSNDLANAAKARSQGVEFEGEWVPMKGLRLGANVTYLKAYYLSYPNANQTTIQGYCATPAALSGGAGTPYCLAQFPAGVPPVNDLSGQATPFAPKWSASLMASYAISLPGDFKFTTELDPYFTAYYDTVSGDPFYRVPAYVRLDGRLAFGPQDGHWSVDLIGKNLTDRIILVGPTIYTFTKERPRNVALQFRYHF
jgi:outer membrane receptor protein involved in Fe transport